MKILKKDFFRRVEILKKQGLKKFDYIYAVPKSGLICALYIAQSENNFPIINSLKKAEMLLIDGCSVAILDDVKDSGWTETKLKKRFEKYSKKIRFFYLVDKQEEKIDAWVTFPWNDFDEIRDEKDKVNRKAQKAKK